MKREQFAICFQYKMNLKLSCFVLFAIQIQYLQTKGKNARGDIHAHPATITAHSNNRFYLFMHSSGLTLRYLIWSRNRHNCKKKPENM
jgi:hypothetical protein